jgi:DivIVA domain-containing protein
MGKRDISTGEAAVPSALTPADIQQKEFRVSRFGGYKMRDVDEFLDQLTDSFTALMAEVERLRAGGADPVVGAPDLDDVSRQADEIIARARAEAARITAEARAGGASVPGVAASGPQDRAAVTAFIERERAFLQSLAGLVQEHAESVKGMARDARRAPAEAAMGSVPSPTPNASASEASTIAPAVSRATPPAAAKASAAPIAEPSEREPAARSADEADEADATAEPSAPARDADAEDTVRIEEPATAAATRGERETDGDRSLRELFWGED